MSLGEHLGELRTRLMIGLIGPVIAAAVLLVYGRSIVAWLAQPLHYALRSKGLSAQLYTTAVPEAFATYLKVAFIGGLIVGVPWLLYQLWKFIAPGLYAGERRFIYILLPGSAALAALGVAFMYFVLLPVTISFLIEFTLSFPMPEMTGSPIQRQIEQLYGTAGAQAEPINEPPAIWPRRTQDPVDPADGSVWINVPQRALKVMLNGHVFALQMTSPRSMAAPIFKMNEYIGFVLMLAVGCGIGFQLPMVMLALGWTGIVSHRAFARGRKWALLACVAAAAVLTPPDVASQILLGGSMYVLYEFGLVLMLLMVRRREPAP